MEIEKSIIKTYKKEIWSKFIKAIKDYQLIRDKDKIAVCISGGKDSFLMAKCFQELQKHQQMNFTLEFILMNPGYSKEHLKNILDNAQVLNIPLTIFKTDIFKIISNLKEGFPCYLCARMRRGHLYNQAQKLGCNKIALGHHFDDVVETILLNMFYASEIKTMMPKLKSTNYSHMELIRPMYLIKETSIVKWTKYNDLNFINCACHFTKEQQESSKRIEIKKLLNELKKQNKYIDENILKSINNINLNQVLGYRKNNQKYNYLDEY